MKLLRVVCSVHCKWWGDGVHTQRTESKKNDSQWGPPYSAIITVNTMSICILNKTSV